MCDHGSFDATIEVCRISHEEQGPITAYEADLRIACKECNEPFVFKGLEAGLSFDSPRTNVDGTELRIPIAPKSNPFFGKGAGYEVVISAPHTHPTNPLSDTWE